MISQEEFAERFLKAQEEPEMDIDDFDDPFEAEGKRLVDSRILELSRALEESEGLLEKETAAKEAALAQLEFVKTAHDRIHSEMESMKVEMDKHRAAHMAEMERRVAAETSLAVERAKPAPKPEQVLVPVEKLVHGPVPEFKMTVNRDRNGRIIEALISPGKT